MVVDMVVDMAVGMAVEEEDSLPFSNEAVFERVKGEVI
jgi:hypothetical protein